MTRALRRGRRALRRTARRLEPFCARALLRDQMKNDRKWQRPNRRLIVADRGWQLARGVSALSRAAIFKYRDDPDALFEAGTIRFCIVAGKTVVFGDPSKRIEFCGLRRSQNVLMTAVSARAIRVAIV